MTLREVINSFWQGGKVCSALIVGVIIHLAISDGNYETAWKLAGTVGVYGLFQVFADWKLESAKKWISDLRNNVQ